MKSLSYLVFGYFCYCVLIYKRPFEFQMRLLYKNSKRDSYILPIYFGLRSAQVVAAEQRAAAAEAAQEACAGSLEAERAGRLLERHGSSEAVAAMRAELTKAEKALREKTQANLRVLEDVDVLRCALCRQYSRQYSGDSRASTLDRYFSS